MKKILVLLFALTCSSVANSQNFEGIITWKMTTEMDAATKAKMDEAKRKMSDPATQAKMKEMKEKMNDPQFKAMMESNPQLKAQMENMMKMAEGGEVKSMMPTGLVIKIKDLNSLTKMEGGIMGNVEMLYLKDKNMSYRIDREAKTYTPLTHAGTDSLKVSDVKVTKTGETTKILNYTCTKYIVESNIQGHPVQQILWATNEIKDLDIKSLAKQRVGNGQQGMFYDKVDGIPLKMEMKQAQGSMIMEVVDLKRQSIPSSEFSLPKDFKEVK